ncbi:uncharacterized protein [Diadema setosum]|uniref:uncharacterized protein n=1 Tax=Diadema setosum TaxID=31175 RepID=UPI003B3B9264
MPIIRTLKESGLSYEAAKRKLLMATAHLQEGEGLPPHQLQSTEDYAIPKRRRPVIESSSSSSSSSNDDNGDDDGDEDDDDDDDDDDDAEDDGDNDDDDAAARERMAKIHKSREKKLLKSFEKNIMRKRKVVYVSRPSSYQRTEMHTEKSAKPKTKKPSSSMAVIAALNESSEEADSDEESEMELTKEAQEEEAFSLYKRALEYQRSGQVDKAGETYRDLLQTRFLAKVKAPEGDRRGVTSTAITLKYSTYKNVGNLASDRGDLNTAMENYLEAVTLDGTDVTLWYKIGSAAVKLYQLALARVAFEQGLRCSKHHWPCLDNLCTILYAINDYVTCLYYIAQALERDRYYMKGLALRDQIYSEQPCLRRDCLDLFKHCDDAVFYSEAPREKSKQVVEEALSLRRERQRLAKDPPLPRIKFLQKLTEYKWKPLGERLVALYDHMTSKDPPMSLVTILDLDEYQGKTHEDNTRVSSAKPEMVDRPLEAMDVQSPAGKPSEKDSEKDVAMEPSGSMGRVETERDKPRDKDDRVGEQEQRPPAEVMPSTDQPAPGGDGPRVDGEKEDGVKMAKEKEREAGEEKALKMEVEEESTLGSSAKTLKQLAAAFLKDQNAEATTAMGGTVLQALGSVGGQGDNNMPLKLEDQPASRQPDSTVECPSVTQEYPLVTQDTSLAASEAQPHFGQLDSSTAGSSQDSIQQPGKETNLILDPTPVSTPTTTIAKRKPGRPRQSEALDLVAMETEDGQSEKSRRGPKRKRLHREEPAPGKRRSARVRNTTVKKKEEEEIINYSEVLRQFLPISLQVGDEEDESVVDLRRASEASATKADGQKKADGSLGGGDDVFVSTETDDVLSFLAECRLNSGVVDVMSRFLERLVARHDLRWPSGLAGVFLEVYKRLRKHTSLPELFCCDEDESVVRETSLMCLLATEFNLDECLSSRTNGNAMGTSPSMIGTTAPVCSHKWGEHHDEDMGYLQELTLMEYMLPDMWPMVPARVFWLRARYFLQFGQMEQAEDAFLRCRDVLRREAEKEEGRRPETGQKEEEEEEEKMETEAGGGDGAHKTVEVEVLVPNVRHGGLISIASVSSEMESLQRCQSLDQLQRLQAAGSHSKVVELLRPSLRSVPRPVRPEGTPERCSQLLLLAQSLAALKDWKEAILTGILSVVEAWQGRKTGGQPSCHALWLETLNKLLGHLEKAFLSCEIGCLGCEGAATLRKAVNVLIKIIEWSMALAEVNELSNTISVMAWIVLYYIIRYEEDRTAARSTPSGGGERTDRSRSPSPVPMLPRSLMLLENAHDYLGRRTWCCNHEGALLKLYIRVLWEELTRCPEGERHPFSSDLRHTLEQCFFCLYGHPTKRAKTKHLQDHGVMEVPLEWSNCCYIFDYFKPKVFPEFDSYKTSSMSSELEGLLLKISRVIPADAKPTSALEYLQAYIDGSSDKTPALPDDYTVPNTVIQEIYYLLADYYFKNKEFGKAIKFYLHDLCVSPNRLDSWAGLALARVGRLDLKLNNSTDSKTEGAILKPGAQALRCFKRALELEPTNFSLWIEYGSGAYILHSHASRQIKQREQLGISADDAVALGDKQKEMLAVAEQCFQQALVCEGEGDEEWLVHYMLGKVAEKRSLLEESLKHYLQASHHLHENEARYPKKIPYHNPPDLSLEALEMYFRIHAAVLKLIQCSELGSRVKGHSYTSLEGMIREAAQLPFVRAEEKKRDPSSEHSTDTEQEARTGPFRPDPATVVMVKTSGSPVYVATPQDHDYLRDKHRRQRSRVSSQEDMTTDTASESDIFSGDESMSSFPIPSRSSLTLRPVPVRRPVASAVEAATGAVPSSAGMRRGSITRPDTSSLQTPRSLQTPSTPDAAASSALVSAARSQMSDEKEQNGKAQQSDQTEIQTDSEADKQGVITKDIPAIVVSEPSPEQVNSDSAESQAATPDPEVQQSSQDQERGNEGQEASDRKDTGGEDGLHTNVASEVTEEMTDEAVNASVTMETDVDANLSEDGEKAGEVIKETAQSSEWDTRQCVSPDRTNSEELNEAGRKEADGDDVEQDRMKDGSKTEEEEEMELEQAKSGEENEDEEKTLAEKDKDAKKKDEDSTKLNIPKERKEGEPKEEEEEVCEEKPVEAEDDARMDVVPTASSDEPGASTPLQVRKDDARMDVVPTASSDEPGTSTLLQVRKDDARMDVVPTASSDEPGASTPLQVRKDDARMDVVPTASSNESGASTPFQVRKDDARMDVVPTASSDEPGTSTPFHVRKDDEEDRMDQGDVPHADQTGVTMTTGVGESEEDIKMGVEEEQGENETVTSHLVSNKGKAETAKAADSSDAPSKELVAIESTGSSVTEESKSVTLQKTAETMDDQDEALPPSEEKQDAVAKQQEVEGGTREDRESASDHKLESEPSELGEGLKTEESKDAEDKMEKNETKMGDQEEVMDVEKRQEDGRKDQAEKAETGDAKVDNREESAETEQSGGKEKDPQGNPAGRAVEKSGAPSDEDAVQRSSEAGGMDDGQREKENNKEEEEEEEEVEEGRKERHIKLIDACVAAMKLCLQRFPQHYKSAYRLAFIYAHTPSHKNLAWSRDILIAGGASTPTKPPPSHMVAPGLFYEQHKNRNLFQGIWRIPIQDIDRSGSFPWHMYRSVSLLVFILTQLADYRLLLQVAVKLYRTPDQGKKYLRDSDRLYLAQEAFNAYVSTVCGQIGAPSLSEYDRVSLVLSTYHCLRNSQDKMPRNTDISAELLVHSYTAYRGKAIGPAVYDEAVRFCNHHLMLLKPPHTPTWMDPSTPRSFLKDVAAALVTGAGQSSETRRALGQSLPPEPVRRPLDEGKEARIGRTKAEEGVEGGQGDVGRRDAEATGVSAGQKEAGFATKAAEAVAQAEDAATHIISSTSSAPQEEMVKAGVQGEIAQREGDRTGSKDWKEASDSGQVPKPEDTASSTTKEIPVGSAKRKFSQMASTEENVAMIVRQVARQYELSLAQERAAASRDQLGDERPRKRPAQGGVEDDPKEFGSQTTSAVDGQNLANPGTPGSLGLVSSAPGAAVETAFQMAAASGKSPASNAPAVSTFASAFQKFVSSHKEPSVGSPWSEVSEDNSQAESSDPAEGPKESDQAGSSDPQRSLSLTSSSRNLTSSIQAGANLK